MLFVAKLTSEFTSLEKPVNDFDMAIVAVVLADGSNFIGSVRQIDPIELTQNFRLPIVRSTFCSNPAKIGARVGG
jgi:hypothetical protein